MSKNNCIKLKKFFEYAAEKLKQENLRNHYDENTHWEDIACKILNIAYDWNLQNLNEIIRNYPAIDLGDSHLKIGVQVSTQYNATKIKDTLEKLSNTINGIHIYELYNNVFFFLPGYYAINYNEKSVIVPEYAIFNNSHIIDFAVFQETFCELNDLLQNQILEILETDLHIRPSYELSAEPISHCNFIQGSRKTEMKLLDEAFKRSKNVFLWGLGGIGKTELAVAWGIEKIAQGEYVYLVHYRDSIIDTVCNMDFSGFEYSKYGTYTDDTEKKRAQFRQKLNVLRKYYSNAILIIDNFDKDSPKVTWADMQNQEGYADLISLKTRLLFTTRFEVKTSAIYVGEMKLDDLLTLFKENAKDVLKSQQEPQAIELIKLAEKHTLTVDLMSKSLFDSEGEMTIDSLIKAFNDNALDERPLPAIDATHNSKFSDFEHHELRILGHLKKLFEISNLNENQLNVMCHAFLLPETGMSIQRFHQCQTDIENETLTQSLIRRSWLQINKDHTHISMHSIIRQVCHSELTFTDDNCSSFLHNLVATIQPSESQLALKPIYDTIIRASKILEDSSGEWHILAGRYYRFMGCYYTAIDYLKTAIERTNQNSPDDKETLAIIFNEIALTYVRLNNFENAICHNLDALKFLQNLDNDGLCAKIYHDLGTAYSFLAEEKEDMSLFYKSLEYINAAQNINATSSQLGKQLYLSNNIHNIGNVYAKIGKTFHDQDQLNYYKKALENHQKALQIRLEIPDISDNILSRSYNAIGNDYANIKDDKNALKQRIKALEYSEHFLLDNHPDIAQKHSNIAHSCQQFKNYEAAIEHYEKAISIYEMSLPQEQKNLTLCEYHLMQIYWEKSNAVKEEDLKIAKEYGERAYNNAQKLRDKKLLENVTRLLAKIYDSPGNRKKEQELLYSLVEVTQPEEAAFSKKYLSSLRSLAIAAWKNQDLFAAKQHYADLYKYEINNTPEQYDNIIDTLYYQGLIDYSLHSFDSSLSYLQQAEELYYKHASTSKFKISKIKKTIYMVSRSKQKHNKR